MDFDGISPDSGSLKSAVSPLIWGVCTESKGEIENSRFGAEGFAYAKLIHLGYSSARVLTSIPYAYPGKFKFVPTYTIFLKRVPTVPYRLGCGRVGVP